MNYINSDDDKAQWRAFHKKDSDESFTKNAKTFRDEMSNFVDYFASVLKKDEKNVEMLEKLNHNEKYPENVREKITHVVELFKTSGDIYGWYGNVCMIALDINEYCYHIILSKDEYEWRTFARHIYTILYEQQNTLFQQLNKYIKESKGIGGYENPNFQNLKSLRDEFVSFINSYKDISKQVRVNTDAHFDQDFRNRLKIIEQLSYRSTIGICVDYLEKVGALMKVQMPFLIKMEERLTHEVTDVEELLVNLSR